MSCLSNEQMRRMMDAVTGYCGPSPDAVKAHTISHSVERFCKDIGGIRAHLGPVNANRPNHIYFAVAPYGGVVMDVKHVAIGNVEWNPANYIISFSDDGRARIALGDYPVAAGESIQFDIYWRPGERTVQMPPQWFDKHFDALMHGSIAAILSQVGTAWGNPQLAKQFEEEYARDVHDCIYDLRMDASPRGRLTAFDPAERWI